MEDKHIGLSRVSDAQLVAELARVMRWKLSGKKSLGSKSWTRVYELALRNEIEYRTLLQGETVLPAEGGPR